MRHASIYTHTALRVRRRTASVRWCTFFQLDLAELIEIATWPTANLRFLHSVLERAVKTLVRPL